VGSTTNQTSFRLTGWYPGPSRMATSVRSAKRPTTPWDTITSAEPGISGSIRVSVAAAPAGTFSH